MGVLQKLEKVTSTHTLLNTSETLTRKTITYSYAMAAITEQLPASKPKATTRTTRKKFAIPPVKLACLAW